MSVERLCEQTEHHGNAGREKVAKAATELCQAQFKLGLPKQALSVCFLSSSFILSDLVGWVGCVGCVGCVCCVGCVGWNGKAAHFHSSLLPVIRRLTVS